MYRYNCNTYDRLEQNYGVDGSGDDDEGESPLRLANGETFVLVSGKFSGVFIEG